VLELELQTKLEPQQLQMEIHKQVQLLVVLLEVLDKAQVLVQMEVETQVHQDQECQTLMEMVKLLEVEEVAQAPLLQVHNQVVKVEPQLHQLMVDQQTVLVLDQVQLDQVHQAVVQAHQLVDQVVHQLALMDVQLDALRTVTMFVIRLLMPTCPLFQVLLLVCQVRSRSAHSCHSPASALRLVDWIVYKIFQTINSDYFFIIKTPLNYFYSVIVKLWLITDHLTDLMLISRKRMMIKLIMIYYKKQLNTLNFGLARQ